MKNINFKKTIIGLLAILTINGYAHTVSDEHFPADYFMVHKNIPHYMQVFRQFGDDKTLNLSDEQKKKLQILQEKVVTMVSQTASQIKDLELTLQKRVVLENKNSKQMKDLIKHIATLRMQLTNAHIDCIYNVKQILSPEQDIFFRQKLDVQK